MSTTTPQERMAIARAAKAERAFKAVEQKRAVESQKKPPTPASTLDSIPQESSMSEEYWSEEEEPPRSTQKRKREITVEDFIPEPVAPKKKKIKINAAPVTPVSWKYSLADMVSSTLPVLGQLTLLAAGVVASVALRMPVEATHPNVPHNNSTMLEVDHNPSYTKKDPPVYTPRVRNPDDYSFVQ